MGKKHSEPLEYNSSRFKTELEIDYSPKIYTLKEQIVFGVKLISIAGVIVLLFFVIGKFM